jgi:hypothetical protein
MIKDIKYSGFSANPSDYESQDGSLAGVINMLEEDNSVRPVFPPKSLFTLGVNLELRYIHDVKPEKNYIIYNTSTCTLYYANYSKENSTLSNLEEIGSFTGATIYNINAIGNILLILTDKGIYYILWKVKEHYHMLGTHLPECSLSFGLQYTIERSDEFTVDYSGHSLMYASGDSETAFENQYSDSTTATGLTNTDNITQLVLGQVNKFINENSVKKGRFIFPFFIRYAYRLYDGTLTMQSAPILMLCADGCSPIAYITDRTYESNSDSHGYYSSWKSRITSAIFDIDCAVVKSQDIDNLKNWSDIVKSIDIFISSPLYTYDQSGKIERNDNAKDWNYNFCAKKKDGSSLYQKQTFRSAFTAAFGSDFPQLEGNTSFVEKLPKKSTDAVESSMEGASHFYLLKSIKIEELTTIRTKIDVKDDYLQSLTEREELPDDYDSHDILIPKISYVYNAKLNLANLTKIPFSGFSPDGLCTYCNDNLVTKQIWIYIKQDGKEYVVPGTATSYTGLNGDVLYLYYPNINAYKAVVKIDSTYYEYPLSNHDMLNGAFYFKSFSAPTTVAPVPVATASEDMIIPMTNKVYTSQVNQPLVYPVTSINTVGTSGEIRGLVSATIGLSANQNGRFPMYAFTDGGIWAFEVNTTTGGYLSKEIVTRDVCTNFDSITQLDRAVVFAADRGLMLLEETSTTCISEVLDDHGAVFSFSNLPSSDDLLKIMAKISLGLDKIADGDLTDDQKLQISTVIDGYKSDLTLVPFHDFIQDCRIIYDYTHQRIIVYNPDNNSSYAYIYSMRSKLWGMIHSTFFRNINSYPDALVFDKDRNVVDVCQEDLTKTQYGLLITRPLKLDAADVLKTIDTIIQRGQFHSDHVQQILFGSRDLYHWQLIWSSQDKFLRGFSGTPYKYFILVLPCQFLSGESISGCSVSYKPRLNDQMR